MAHPHLELAALACGLALLACRRPPTPTHAPAPAHARPTPLVLPPPEPGLIVPRTRSPIAVDGALTEAVWRDALHAGPFRDPTTNLLAVPHSELRLAHDGQRLLLGLYAADEDIHASVAKDAPGSADDDAFVVQIQNAAGVTYQLNVAANGVVRDGALAGPLGKPAATCAVELDGTLNNPADDDEEWVAECLVPLAPLSARIGDTLEVTATRCDTPKGAARRCGVWDARVQLQ